MNWNHILELVSQLAKRNALVAMQATDQLYLLVTPEAFEELRVVLRLHDQEISQVNQPGSVVFTTQINFRETPVQVSTIVDTLMQAEA